MSDRLDKTLKRNGTVAGIEKAETITDYIRKYEALLDQKDKEIEGLKIDAVTVLNDYKKAVQYLKDDMEVVEAENLALKEELRRIRLSAGDDYGDDLTTLIPTLKEKVRELEADCDKCREVDTAEQLLADIAALTRQLEEAKAALSNLVNVYIETYNGIRTVRTITYLGNYIPDHWKEAICKAVGSGRRENESK